METRNLRLKGMSCASCASSIEQAIQEVSGVTKCNVNFALSQSTVTYNPQQTNLNRIQAAVTEAGYAAVAESEQEEDAEKKARVAEQKEITRKVIVGSIISILLIIGVLPMMTGLELSWVPRWLQNFWVQFILVTPVQFWVGKAFFVGGWKAFKRHSANMDTLVALGTAVAYFYSLFVTIFPEVLESQGLEVAVYYEVASVVITLVLLGRLLENRAK